MTDKPRPDFLPVVKPKPSGGRSRGYFPKVREAREALKERAIEILDQYLEVVKQAQAHQDFEVAAESLQWLMEHMPDDEGARMVEPSVDKKTTQEKGNSGPTIQIGIAVSGVKPTQSLAPAPTTHVIDLEAEDSE